MCPPPSFRAAVGGLLAAVACGCTDDGAVRPGDIRTYVAPAEPPARRAPAAERAAVPRVRYDVPEGWAEIAAGGMRLAALAIGDPADGHEVTVIPAAGTLRSNVERWQKQLDETAPEADRAAAVEQALAAAETVDVDGTQATVVMLVDAAAAADADAAGQAILGAMIPLDDSAALFVKFKGAADVARRERDRFVGFVSSLRWK